MHISISETCIELKKFISNKFVGRYEEGERVEGCVRVGGLQRCGYRGEGAAEVSKSMCSRKSAPNGIVSMSMKTLSRPNGRGADPPGPGCLAGDMRGISWSRHTPSQRPLNRSRPTFIRHHDMDDKSPQRTVRSTRSAGWFPRSVGRPSRDGRPRFAPARGCSRPPPVPVRAPFRHDPF
jgi:hypothetical protein